jgi:glycosyltransferase involved in cell wall biosynthesis
MRRVNILFVITQMGMGGSERLVHNLALRLDRDRFNPSVAWFDGHAALKEFEDLQVPLHYVPKKRRVDFSTMHKLARIIRAERIDIVNAQHFMPAIYAYYGCKLMAKKALVFTAHSRWEIEDTPFKWRVAGGYLLRRIDASVGVSPDVSSAIQSVFKTKALQTVTIENGVDTDLFGRRRDVRGLRASLGLTDRDIVIGTVGNLKTVKNHLLLLQAFAKVAEKRENVKLLIVGRGSMVESDDTEDDLRLFVNNHRLAQRVLFLGYRTDIPMLLDVMDIFCLTSLREGLPLSLMEAMATGLPVIGTNVQGIRDVITPNVTGMLIELGDVTALANALIGLIGDERWRTSLGSAGREKALEKYSLQRCVREYEQLFSSLVPSPYPLAYDAHR